MAFQTEKKKYAKEHLWFVEIEVGGTIYRFCENRSPLPIGLEATPSLQSIRTNPAEIKLEGGMGVRAKCSITLLESSDYTQWGTITDPVRFWARWRAETPFYLGKRVSVFSGYIVNNTYNANNFIRRDYVMESFAQTAGGVSITGKDPLKLASNDRAKAPLESNGSLLTELTETTSTFNLQPAGIGDLEYPATDGIIRIGEELILYTTRTGDNISGVTRGFRNTEISSHAIGDVVQLCLQYDAETVSNIVYDLLVNYAGIDASFINKPEWDAESANAFITSYGTLLTEPEGVQDLIKEFAQSAPFYLYYDERVNQIRFKALKPPADDAQLFTWQANFIEGSTGVKDMQDMRVSTVVVNYGIINPTKDLDEKSNYRSTYAREDTDSVTDYGQRAYKTINSRWISIDNQSAARLVAARIGRRFSQAPRMLTFAMDAKDSDVWTGDSIQGETDLILEPTTGNIARLPYQILSASEGKNYSYTALEHSYGEAVPGDEDVEDPNVRLVFIGGEVDQLKDVNGTPRTLRQLFADVFPADEAAPDPDLDIRFIFESNAVAGSSDNTIHAVKTGSWPELNTPILVQNSGLIVGRGGDGQSIGTNTLTVGGPAILLQDDIRLQNFNVIGGGGGGGNSATIGRASAAGGGGAGFSVGLGGGGTSYNPPEDEQQNTAAQNGTFTDGGLGGTVSGQTGGEFDSATGGAGGDLGQAGALSGAAAGKAIDLNGFTVTYVETGTILGAVS